MKKEVYTENAPKPIGPYSQAVISNNFLFTAGQIAIDPATGEMVKKDIRSETETVMKNLKAILDKAGIPFENVVKTTIYLSDLENFAAVNEIYGSYFKSPYPVRETVEVKRLPKDANVEISLVASIEGK